MTLSADERGQLWDAAHHWGAYYHEGSLRDREEAAKVLETVVDQLADARMEPLHAAAVRVLQAVRSAENGEIDATLLGMALQSLWATVAATPDKLPQGLRPITGAPLICLGCGWRGIVAACEPDDDGCLLCPKCGKVTRDVR